MFYCNGDEDEPFASYKPKAKVKAKPKKVSAKKTVVKKVKVVVKKVDKPKKIKPKAYKIAGSFTLDSEGKLLKQTKSINGVVVSKKEIVVTFVVKLK
jgi:hypothetical protein